jgi:hypothetical protein
MTRIPKGWRCGKYETLTSAPLQARALMSELASVREVQTLPITAPGIRSGYRVSQWQRHATWATPPSRAVS